MSKTHNKWLLYDGNNFCHKAAWFDKTYVHEEDIEAWKENNLALWTYYKILCKILEDKGLSLPDVSTIHDFWMLDLTYAQAVERLRK